MASTTRVETTLAARAIGARTDFSGVAITDLSAEEDRFIQIILSEGVIKPVNGFQVVAGSLATMDLVVGSGNATEDYFVVPCVMQEVGDCHISVYGNSTILSRYTA